MKFVKIWRKPAVKGRPDKHIQWLRREIPLPHRTSVTKGVMHYFYGDESSPMLIIILFVSKILEAINNCVSFGPVARVKNCCEYKWKMTKQKRYKSNDAEMQKNSRKSRSKSYSMIRSWTVCFACIWVSVFWFYYQFSSLDLE